MQRNAIKLPLCLLLAHKVLQFGNTMCNLDHPDCPIIAILDWEFSGVVPAPRWNPPRAFLWNTKISIEKKAEQSRMEDIFKAICQEKGLQKMLDEIQLDPLQDSIGLWLSTLVQLSKYVQERRLRAVRFTGERSQKQHWRSLINV